MQAIRLAGIALESETLGINYIPNNGLQHKQTQKREVYTVVIMDRLPISEIQISEDKRTMLPRILFYTLSYSFLHSHTPHSLHDRIIIHAYNLLLQFIFLSRIVRIS